MQALLAVDIGTTTVCGVAVSPSGELLASVERPNDSAVAGLPAGRAEQAPLRIRDRAFEVLRELRTRVSEVLAIGLTGQMHGMLCVDRQSRPLGNLVTWQDGRCLEPDSGGKTALLEMRRRVPDDRWSSCGCLPASGFLGSTLFWMTRHAALPDGTARVGFIHDWVGACLTGGSAVTDPADAASAGLFNLERMEWDAEIVAALGLPGALLPPVRPSGSVIGKLTASAEVATGIPEGTPVCNATGDNQASVLGSVSDLASSILVNLGTGGQISWTVPGFCRVPGMETRYLPHGRYMLVGASLAGGRAYAWLNETVRRWLAQFAVSPDRETVYERLNALASGAPEDCGGLRARTTYMGTRLQPTLRGGFEGIDLENFSLGNAARAVLTGMVDELLDFRRAAGDAAPGTTQVVVGSGNALRKNPLLRKIVADRAGCAVVVPGHREEAAFGAALLAGVEVEVWADLSRAAQSIRYAQD